MNRRTLLAALTGVSLLGQERPATSGVAKDEPPVEFVCPMDPDIRSPKPGRCPRCGMALVAGIPDAAEYLMSLTVRPAPLRAGVASTLTFAVTDPKTGKPAKDFIEVHERLFHMFLVSRDLKHFMHDHPVLQNDGSFRLQAVFPQPGMYRVLGDFYPKGGTPQLIAKTVIVPGPGVSLAAPKLAPELGLQHGDNIDVTLTTEPAEPISGAKTLMFFDLKPGAGIEPYLGAWGHMLAASSDLIDLIHTHPFLADGGPRVQFNIIFPRPGVYRVWVQFQRQGKVNTVAFNVPAKPLA